MKSYDAKCPICGTITHNLYLAETHGWMECEHCKQTVQVLKFAADKKVPLYTPQQLVACFAAVT